MLSLLARVALTCDADDEDDEDEEEECVSDLGGGGRGGGEQFGSVSRQINVCRFVFGLVVKRHIAGNKPDQPIRDQRY